MTDRVLVASSVPVTTGDDGVPRVAFTGSFTQSSAVADSIVDFIDADDSAVTLLDASDSRNGFRIQNTSPSLMYLLMENGGTPTTTHFSVVLPQYAYITEDNYSGQVSAVWETGASTGGAAVTSLVSEEA